MNTATFNALPVVDNEAAALLLVVGTDFLFSDGTPGVNSQQNRTVGEPGINRVTYYRRIEADKVGGPLGIGANFTQTVQPVSAGGPFPPLAPSGIAYAPDQACCPPPLVSEVIPATAPIPYANISYPADGVLAGQGREGYVRIYDVLT